MRKNNWMKFILDSQKCEMCAESPLEIKKTTIDLEWGNSRGDVPMTISFVPLLVCKSCGHAHITNAVLATLRDQFLEGGSHGVFSFDRYQERLNHLTVEEQWIEENYYYSTTAVSDGFEIKVLNINEDKKFHREEAFYG